MTNTGSHVNRNLLSRRPIVTVSVLLTLCAVGFVLLQLWLGSRLPLDSPLPMMFRTEAQMQSLLTAIDKYENMYGRYPVSGGEGIEAAVDALNTTVTYLTEIPRDAWGRPFVYVRADDYSTDSLGGVHDPGTGEFFNPDSYQLYSLGMDGARERETDSTDPFSPNLDNINNWDRKRSWRKVYHRLQQEYKHRGKTGDAAVP